MALVRLIYSSIKTEGVEVSDLLGLFDKSAEREALISLIAAVETIIKRKSLILKTIDSFNHGASQQCKNNLLNHDFGSHFAWLVANLQTTNDALSKSRHYLQVLYGKALSKT